MEFPKILGVFSKQQDQDLGAGGTQRKNTGKTYWYVRQLTPLDFEIQPLNSNHVPSGIKLTIQRPEFAYQYTPEPRYYRSHTVPALETLARKVQLGERYFNLGMLDDAELEFIKALMVDDMNIEANYGLGKVYSEKKEYQKLKKVLSTLLGIEGAFDFEYRQKFNEFGISLRKNGHYDESISYYNKALEFNQKDEHLYFNLARVYFDKGEPQGAVDQLQKALSLNPDFVEAKKFLAYCNKRI